MMGCPPTDLKARTGELTPPGRRFWASAKIWEGRRWGKGVAEEERGAGGGGVQEKRVRKRIRDKGREESGRGGGGGVETTTAASGRRSPSRKLRFSPSAFPFLVSNSIAQPQLLHLSSP